MNMTMKRSLAVAVLFAGASFALNAQISASALVLYDYEDGALGDAVATITDNVGSNNMNVKVGGQTVTLTNSATAQLGLAGYYNGTTQTVMTNTTGANIGSLAPFAVTGWINATTTTSNVFVAGNRYGTSAGSAGWTIDITRCNVSGGTNNNINFNYSNTTGNVLSYRMGTENVAGNELGWLFFAWMGVDNGNGSITLNLYVGDTTGSLSLVGSSIQGTGTGNNPLANAGFGSSSVKSTTAQFKGMLDEMTIWNSNLSVETSGSEVTGGQLHTLYTSAIPEPSVSAGLLGLAGMIWVFRRRR